MNKKVLIFFIIVSFAFSAYPVFADQSTRAERTTVNGMSIILQKNQSEVAEITLLLKSGSGIEPAAKKGTAYIMNSIVYWILNDPRSKSGSADITTQPDYTLIRLTDLSRDIKPTLEKIKYLLTQPLYSYDAVIDLREAYGTDLKGMLAATKSYADFTKGFYGPSHPYNDWPNAETMAAVTGPDVYKWYRQTYQPGNAILSISGGVNQSITDLEKFFADMNSETVDRRLLIQPVFLKENKQVRQVDPNGRATSLCMGFSAPRIQDPEFPAFRILAYYLEEYQHYFAELREKEGLFYAASVYYNYLEKPKAPNIAFITMTDPDSLKTLESRTLELVNGLTKNGIPQTEIDKVIEAIRVEDEARKASGKGMAARNALSQYLQTQLIYDETLLPKLELVKTEDIQKAARKYLQNYVEVSYIPEKVAPNL